MKTMVELGCTGEFGCDCPEKRQEMRHGTRAMYQQGCRCTRCKGANAEYQLNYRNGYHRGTS